MDRGYRSWNSEMDKSIQRSHSGLDAQPCMRKPRKGSKKSQNAVSDGRGGANCGSHPDQPFPLFNNRSLSMLSTMHHLNPHRKVAMSPEILRDAEEQANSLRKTAKQLQDQLEKSNREKARIHRFLSDLLYTLNARGYESVRDHEGTLVDLNKCKGENYLDLKGRDLKQRVNVRRPGGQEFLLKAVIGNQERAIQSLVFKLDAIGREILLGNRLTVDDSSAKSTNDNTKTASLEAEVLQLVTLIEGACFKCPEIYPVLRDHYFSNEESMEMNMRNPVIQNLLKKCEQLATEAHSRKLVEMLSNGTNNIINRPKSQQTTVGNKPTKIKTATKPRSASSRAPRTVSSEILGLGNPPLTCRPAFDSKEKESAGYARNGLPPPSVRNTDNHLRRLNGQSKSENSFQTGDTDYIKMATSSSISSGEPGPSGMTSHKSTTGLSLNDSCVSVCPYCSRKFGLEESISDIKNHIEMHIFADRDRILDQK